MARRPAISGLHPAICPDGRRGHADPQIFDRFRFSALASQPPFIPRPPIYAGVERTSVSQGQRMPTSRPEKFTVIQTNGFAQSRIFFPTENEPIFWYRRPGLKPERGAHFEKCEVKANSQYAIQKTGVNSGSGHADHQGAPTAIPFLRSPDPRKRSHFSPRDRHARVRGAGSSEQPGRAGLL